MPRHRSLAPAIAPHTRFKTVLLLLATIITTQAATSPWLSFGLTPEFLQSWLDPNDHHRLLLHEAAFSHPSVVACVPSKNGITTIRSVFYQLKHPQGVGVRNPYDNSQFTWVDKLPVQEAYQLLTGEVRVLRLAVLRNPFERLASAYVNKVVEPQAFDYVLQYVKERCNVTEQALTFEKFVRCVTSQNPLEVDRHFMPQVRCNICLSQ